MNKKKTGPCTSICLNFCELLQPLFLIALYLALGVMTKAIYSYRLSRI